MGDGLDNPSQLVLKLSQADARSASSDFTLGKRKKFRGARSGK